jgi:predicted HNH restriction endonuclease
MLPPLKDSCSLCRTKNEPHNGSGNGFFELHEKVGIDINENYRRISKGNFITVCPNCHKKEHEKILNSSVEVSLETETFFPLY